MGRQVGTDGIRVSFEQWIGHGLSKQHTVGQELEEGLLRGLVFESNAVANLLTELLGTPQRQPTSYSISSWRSRRIALDRAGDVR